MYIPRIIDLALADWVESPIRKPLLLRGARQVGKTESVRNLGRGFASFVEINFELDRDVHALFRRSLSPKLLMENLGAYTEKSIVPGQSLLFFDEIQACPDALRALRFLHEEMPELHVIAAGSLLEFALAEIPAYGVGRIRSLFMYPMAFDEFLTAVAGEELLKLKSEASPGAPLEEPLHHKLWDYLIKFIALGGLPEVISTYIKTQDINHCIRIQSDLIITLQDDFRKYKEQVPASRLMQICQTVAQQAGDKFVYTRVAEDMNQRQVREGIQLLSMAGLIHSVTYTSVGALPLASGMNTRYRKFLLFDTGIAMRILDQGIGRMLVDSSWEEINKGALAEQFAGTEILKYFDPYTPAQLFYWHRTGSGGKAEIDYVLSHAGKILPVEVKSGGRGAMQSLHLFMKEKKIERGVRIALENFSMYNGIEVYPLYAISNLLRNP